MNNEIINEISENENIAKVDGNGKVTGVGTGTTNVTVTTGNGKSATCKVTVVKQTPSVNYSTHVQDIGWQGYVKDGNTAGSTIPSTIHFKNPAPDK